jgi:hypothetical protein
MRALVIILTVLLAPFPAPRASGAGAWGGDGIDGSTACAPRRASIDRVESVTMWFSEEGRGGRAPGADGLISDAAQRAPPRE